MTAVVVTGASGLLGSHVVAHLIQAGRDVRAVDIRPGNPTPDCPFVTADLTELGATVQALAGAEAVIHTAAIPRPTGRTGSDVFSTNVLAAYNVTEAAKIHGTRRIVNASSFSVIGWPFNVQPLLPEFLPIDESHPLAPQEAYGLSKLVTEQVVTAAVRCCPPLSAVNLRFPWIQTAASFDVDVVSSRRDGATAPGNLWAYIDAEDAAAAFGAALDATTEDIASVYLSAPDTFMEEETGELVRASFPGVELRRELPGHASLICSDAAERLLGFRPSRSWRSYGGGA
ncbi:MAG TPA: NAD-dependent epimerase/dehydratase family protein [Solirubrobacteraceae bacterium]